MIEPPPIQQKKTCPYCKSLIPIEAVKCSSCSEWVDKRYKPSGASSAAAALLSLLVPGLGQIYKGQPFNGITWLATVVVAYLFIWPIGLLLHLTCIVGAAMKA